MRNNMKIIQSIREFFDPAIQSVYVGSQDDVWTVYVHYKNGGFKKYVCRPDDMHMAAPELAELLYNYHIKKMNRQKRGRENTR